MPHEIKWINSDASNQSIEIVIRLADLESIMPTVLKTIVERSEGKTPPDRIQKRQQNVDKRQQNVDELAALLLKGTGLNPDEAAVVNVIYVAVAAMEAYRTLCRSGSMHETAMRQIEQSALDMMQQIHTAQMPWHLRTAAGKS